jgi:hypothetical protein
VVRLNLLLAAIAAAGMRVVSEGSSQTSFPPISLQGKLNQAIDELGVRYPAGFPHLRVHTYFGESGNRIDLVDEDFPIIPEEKIDSGHTLAGERLESPKGQGLHLFYDVFGKRGRNDQLSSLFVEILGVIRIEIVPRNDLSG